MFENFVETLNITSKTTDTTFEKMSSHLLQKETWKKPFGNKSRTSESAFAAKYKGKQKRGGASRSERAPTASDSS
jgi:hypothetical protein